MRLPSLKKRVENSINTLSNAVSGLYMLTEGISLLEPINLMNLELAQSIESLLEDLVAAKPSEMISLVLDSQLMSLLEELQDADWVSELEGTLLDAAGEQTNPQVAGFINEFVEKIELRYTQLLEAVHAFIALIPNDA